VIIPPLPRFPRSRKKGGKRRKEKGPKVCDPSPKNLPPCPAGDICLNSECGEGKGKKRRKKKERKKKMRSHYHTSLIFQHPACPLGPLTRPQPRGGKKKKKEHIIREIPQHLPLSLAARTEGGKGEGVPPS